MFIRRVSIEGFKKFRDLVSFDFDVQTCLYGDNDEGKTTIAEAIPFCFYGVDLAGNKDYDSLMNREVMEERSGIPNALMGDFESYLEKNGLEKDAQSEERFKIEYGITFEPPKTVVQVVFEYDDGRVFTVERSRTPSSTVVKVNNTKSSQRELDAIVPEKDLFLAIYCPGYFNIGMDVKDRRSMVARFCAKPEGDLLQQAATKAGVALTPELREVLADHANPKLLTSLRHRRREVQGAANEASAFLAGLEAVGDGEAGTRIEADQTIHTAYQKALAEQKEWKEILQILNGNEKIQAENDRYAKRRGELETWIKDSNPEVPDKAPLDKLLAKRGELMDQLDVGPQVEAIPALPDVQTCPSCGVNLHEYFKQEQIKITQKNDQIQTAWEETKKPIREELAGIEGQIATLQTENAERQRNWELRQRFEGELSGMRPIEPTELPEDARVLSSEEIRMYCDQTDIAVNGAAEEWTYESQRVTTHNAKIDHIAESKAQRKEHHASQQKIIDDAPAQISLFEAGEKVLKIYPSVVVTQQVSSVSVHLQRATIKLVEIQKNGALKDTFQVLYDGIPYHRLSNSARIKADIEIARMLNKSSGIDVPVFVDNAESITEMPGMLWDQQHILAYVRAEQTPVISHSRGR